MTDIAPEIYAQIEADFKAGVNMDPGIVKIVKRVSAGKATQKDMATLSERLGVQASKALRKNLVAEALPDQRLYWNIAEKTILPLLVKVYETVNTEAMIAQSAYDKAARLRIGIAKGANPDGIIKSVMENAVSSSLKGELTTALDKPVVTAGRKFYDDFQKENARLRSGLGLETTVVRVYDGVGLHNRKTPCEYCIEREGVWSYEDANANGVFARHPGCGCTIEYHTVKGVEVI